MLTGLIVSRPFLRGESLGLASDLADPGGLVWSFLVLTTLGAWGVWRMWSRRNDILAGPVELCLLLGVVLLFVTAAWASYRRAALLGGWEWLGLVLMLFLVRQLATAARERSGLLAVLMATGVALAVQGVYQAAYELPSQRRIAGDYDTDITAQVQKQFAARLESPDAAELSLLARRLEGYRAHGPYLYSSTLAGALALLLPAIILAALAARRHGAERWQIYLATGAAAVVGLGLWLTREWLFVLAVPLAGAVLLPRWRVPLTLGAVLLGGVMYGSGMLAEDMTRRGDAWGAAWRLLRDGNNGWTGVGLAQSTFWLPRYLSETAGAPIGPESAVLELWAEGGISALLFFAAAALAVVLAVRAWWRDTPPAEREKAEAPGEDLPWEFYLGGMLGVVLAFLVRASSLLQDDLWPAAMLASLAAMSWFAAFAVFEQLTWTPEERMTALGCGALALALALLANPGVGMPSLIGLLFVVVGVMLAEADPRPVTWLSQGELSLNVPAPLFGASAFGLLVLVIIPVSHSSSVHRRAMMAWQIFHAELEKPADERKWKNFRAAINQVAITPLEQAEKEEQKVVRTLLDLSQWRLADWELDPRDLSEMRRAEAALRWAARAQDANLRGTAGVLHLVSARLRIGKNLALIAERLVKLINDPKQKAGDKGRSLAMAGQWRERAEGHFKEGAKEMRQVLPVDPTNPANHYGLARLLHEAGDIKGRREAAAEALRLDKLVGRARRLPSQQREAVEGWLAPEKKK